MTSEQSTECVLMRKVLRKHAKAETDPIAQNAVVEDAEVEAAKRDWENILSDED